MPLDVYFSHWGASARSKNTVLNIDSSSLKFLAIAIAKKTENWKFPWLDNNGTCVSREIELTLNDIENLSVGKNEFDFIIKRKQNKMSFEAI